ncbi:hypothetical protein O181_020179 [Austropuccinia psidii MF-1]|uniref:Nucleoporin Nup133/Nup155-like C-terminal domain-containing protein n=1 Tax=Austropuccinia psidii MF-1 TaxID=1389203 RepID=A0A9Q3C8F4_9BASI|nr:hypothetical protein [Austropuccinia psidii MF-1]
MFSQTNSNASLNARTRSGLRSQSRLNSVGLQGSDDQSQTELNPDLGVGSNGQETSRLPKPNAMLGVQKLSEGFRHRSVTPLTRANASQAMAIAEEQTMALEEGLKQVGQTGTAVSILLQDDFHAVTAYSKLPSDVEQMLSRADHNLDPMKGQIDHITGFASVWSRDHCYVWNFARRTATPPTCYSFPCPISKTASVLVNTLAPLPLVSFISPFANTSNNSRREPGLLLLSPTGELRAWDSLSLALSGVDKYTSIQVQLHDTELVRCLQPLTWCPGSFVLATSHSRLFKLSISAGISGQPTVISSLMSRSNTWGTKLSSLIRWGQNYDPKAGIVALTVSPCFQNNDSNGGSEIWALEVTGALFRWNLDLNGGGDRFIWEKELAPLILENLLSVPDMDILTLVERLEFTFIDLKVTYTRDLAVLVSYVDPSICMEGKSSIYPKSFAVIILDVLSNSTLPVVTNIVKTQHREYPDPRLETAPALLLPHGGPAVFIVFPERVVALSLSPETDFEEVVSFNSIANNRIVGTGAGPLSIRSIQDNDDVPPTLKLITAASGILEIELNPIELVRLAINIFEEQMARDTHRLKMKLDQAVFFSDNPNNPVEFTLPGTLKGDLGSAAEQLSRQILASSAAHLPPIVDLRAQLADRIARLHLLIQFINTTGMLNKISTMGKRRLMGDAELLASTNALWLHHNHHINALSHAKSPYRPFLSEVIATYMSSLGQNQDEDITRLFFRNNVADIGKILECGKAQLELVLSHSSSKLRKRSTSLLEANEILLTVYSSAITFRQAHCKTYDLHNDTTTEPWTSSLNLLEVLQFHYEATLNVLQKQVCQYGSSIEDDQGLFGVESPVIFMVDSHDDNTEDESREKSRNLHHMLKDQLTQLAEKSLSMMQERLAFLNSVLSPNHLESKALQERYLRLRPQLIFGLVKVKRQAYAVSLAESQRDFRTLVELCHASATSQTDRKIQTYIERFGQDFAFQLYQWFVEQGRYHELLTQNSVFAPLVTSFLDSMDYGRFSWIHDLAIDRFSHAANTLVKEAINERELADQKLMLSLGKLCQLAETHAMDLSSEKTLRDIEVVDDRIDIVDAQLRLCGLCNSVLNSQPQYALQPIDQQARVLREHLAHNLVNRPAFQQLFERFLLQILNGGALKIEDLIDLYSLKGNLEDEREDFVIALDTLSRAKDLPPGRADLALKSVWRRIYIHEDWKALKKSSNLSDDDLVTCLKTTALYHVLSNLMNSNATSQTALQILPPTELFFDPTLAFDNNLAVRFPDHSMAELEQLTQAYELENKTLQEAIEEGGVQDFYSEIVRLIQVEGTSDGEQDVMMISR